MRIIAIIFAGIILIMCIISSVLSEDNLDRAHIMVLCSATCNFIGITFGIMPLIILSLVLILLELFIES